MERQDGITAQAQRLWGEVPIRYAAVSKKCEAALNNKVECPLMLQSFTDLPELLDSNQLEALCTDQCAHSLKIAREGIQGSWVKQKLIKPDINAPMGTRERRLAMELLAKDFRERMLREDREVARTRQGDETPAGAE
ncbi:hypothetical protein BST61_g10460 [Cercospora zeina]